MPLAMFTFGDARALRLDEHAIASGHQFQSTWKHHDPLLSIMRRRASRHSLNNHRLELGPTRIGFGYRPTRIPRYKVEGLMLPNSRHTSDFFSSSIEGCHRAGPSTCASPLA